MRWDVFCHVVDNYGDAGVAWRLARILAIEHQADVTLWIDALAPLARVAPAIDPNADDQRADGMRVRRITDPMPQFSPADVVVEAFAGGIPQAYVDAMAARTAPPRWLRLEYLALEPVFDSHHRLSSPHPTLPLARTFWFPGFSPRTGGLLRERELFAERDAFRLDAAAADAFLAPLAVPPRRAGELRVSMFCYPTAPLDALLDAWGRGASPITCIVPQGVAEDAIARLASRTANVENAGSHVRIATIPWLAQRDYDRLLWSCDVNFVRGEDSFVRAQWAASPFVWNAYPQSGGAHAAKIAAFVDRYTAGLDAAAARAVRTLFASWNRLRDAPPIGGAWDAYVRELAALRAWGPRWADALAALPELAANLAADAENRL